MGAVRRASHGDNLTTQNKGSGLSDLQVEGRVSAVCPSVCGVKIFLATQIEG